MSDYALKTKPTSEKIVKILGRTSYRAELGGSSKIDEMGGMDVPAALSLSRMREVNGDKLRSSTLDVGPEILETQITGELLHLEKIIKAYLRTMGDASIYYRAMHRFACSCAQARIASKTENSSRIKLICRYAGMSSIEFEELIETCLAWLRESSLYAERRFAKLYRKN